MKYELFFQEHRPVFPVDVAATDVYQPSLVDHQSAAAHQWPSSKRTVAKAPSQHLAAPQQTPHHHHHHHHHHLTVQHAPKKEPTQLSPVKKRVKEGTPPSGVNNLVVMYVVII